MSQNILWVSLTQAFSFTKGFCLCDQTLLTWVTGSVLPPNMKGYCGFPKLHSMAISMTKGCVQTLFWLIFFSAFSLTMTLWNCCQFKHNWGFYLTGRKPHSASQHSAILNLTSFSSPKPVFLVTIFFDFSSKCSLSLVHRQNVLLLCPHQYLLGSGEKRVTGNFILLCLCIFPSFLIYSQRFKVPNQFLRTLD